MRYGRGMIPDSWIPHRRGDGELVGYVRIEGEAFVPVDLFGHDLAEPSDWHEAESTLEEHGLGWLDGVWLLRHDDGSDERVRIVEVSPTRVLVKTDDMNALGGPEVPRYPVDVPVQEGVLTRAPSTPQEWTPKDRY